MFVVFFKKTNILKIRGGMRMFPTRMHNDEQRSQIKKLQP